MTRVTSGEHASWFHPPVIDRDRDALAIASERHGVITREELRHVGLTPTMIDDRLASGALVPLHPRVYRPAGAPDSWVQRVLAACLWSGPGSAASHRTAAQLWGLDGIPSNFVEISTPRKLHARSVVVHRTFCLRPEHVRVKNAIPVTDPTRTLLDLSSVLPLKPLEAALESAMRKRLTHLDLFSQRFEEWTRKGRTGATKWRILLALRDPKAAPSASLLETLMIQLLRDVGLPSPQRQVEVRNGGRFAGRVDFAYPDLRFGIETSGADPHLAREAWENDHKRNNRLTVAGWRILYFSWHRIVHDPAGVAEEIRAVLRTLTGRYARQTRSEAGWG